MSRAEVRESVSVLRYAEDPDAVYVSVPERWNMRAAEEAARIVRIASDEVSSPMRLVFTRARGGRRWFKFSKWPREEVVR